MDISIVIKGFVFGFSSAGTFVFVGYIIGQIIQGFKSITE